MFIIRCREDGKICQINDEEDVICDLKTVSVGDVVAFYYGVKSYTGIVEVHSDDEKFVREEYERLTKKGLAKTKKVSGKVLQSQASGSKKSLEEEYEEQKRGVDKAERAIQEKMRSLKENKRANTPSNHDESLLMDVDGNSMDSINNIANNKTQSTSRAVPKRPSLNNRSREKNVETAKRSRFTVKAQVYAPASPSGSSSLQSIDDLIDEEDFISEQSPPEGSEDSDVSEDHPPTAQKKKPATRGSRKQRPLRRTQNDEEIPESDDLSPSRNHNIEEDLESEGSESDGDIQDHDHEHLLGKDYPTSEMVHLRDGIYCKAAVKDYAVNGSKNARQCGRKLVAGVLHLKAVLKCNRVLKKSRREGGYERRKQKENRGVNDNQQIQTRAEEREVLYGPAVKAIVDFSMKKADKRKDWTKASRASVQMALTQKIVEVRTCYETAINRGERYEYGNEWFGSDEPEEEVPEPQLE